MAKYGVPGIYIVLLDEVQTALAVKSTTDPLKNGLVSISCALADQIKDQKQAFLPLLAGNATLTDVFQSWDRSRFGIIPLQISPLFSVAHFRSFIRSTFQLSKGSVPQQALEELLTEMWQLFRDIRGIPRLMEFMHSSAIATLGKNLEDLAAVEEKRKVQLQHICKIITDHSFLFLSL